MAFDHLMPDLVGAGTSARNVPNRKVWPSREQWLARVASPFSLILVAGIYGACIATAIWGCGRTAIIFVATLVVVLHVCRLVSERHRSTATTASKYARSAVNAGDIERILRKLDRRVQTHAPHQDPNLTLGKLATDLGVAANDLSQALNSQRGGFHDWLARARVADVQARLLREGYVNMLDVAFACGFNSKSAFYDAFRRVTGLTPVAWRAAMRKPQLQPMQS